MIANKNPATMNDHTLLIVDEDPTFLVGGSFECDLTECSSGGESVEETTDPLENPTTIQDDTRKQLAAAAECLAQLNAVLGAVELPPTPKRRPSWKRLTHSHRANSLPIKPALKSSNSTTIRRNSVSFSQLEIREYDICLSDHPSCSYGPPIQLDWDYTTQRVVDIEDYESQRQRSNFPMLSYNARKFMLQQYSPQELQEAVREVDRVKRQRLVTDLLWPAHPLDELWEDIVRHVRGLFRKEEEEPALYATV